MCAEAQEEPGGQDSFPKCISNAVELYSSPLGKDKVGVKVLPHSTSPTPAVDPASILFCFFTFIYLFTYLLCVQVLMQVHACMCVYACTHVLVYVQVLMQRSEGSPWASVSSSI